KSVGRRRFAVPGQVEGKNAEMAGDRRIVHHVAELPPVRAGGVQADQRNPPPGLLEIQAMRPALDRDMRVTADDGLDRRSHQRTTSARRRGAASISLK